MANFSIFKRLLNSFFFKLHGYLLEAEPVGYVSDKFYRGSSILWAVALLYLVLNPVIIFGKDYLLNQLTLKSKLFSPWSYKTIKKTDAKDQILLNKLNKSIPELIYALKFWNKILIL